MSIYKEIHVHVYIYVIEIVVLCMSPAFLSKSYLYVFYITPDVVVVFIKVKLHN